MTPTLRSTPTVLLAAALLALSFGSGAVAAGLITGADIANGTVESRDIKNQTVKTKDLAPAAVAALQGATGPQGAPGTDGVDGTDGVSGHEMVSASSASVPGSVLATATASCPAGKKVVGGTAYWLASEMPVRLSPDAGGTSTTTWVADGYNPVSAPDQIELRLICVTA